MVEREIANAVYEIRKCGRESYGGAAEVDEAETVGGGSVEGIEREANNRGFYDCDECYAR